MRVNVIMLSGRHDIQHNDNQHNDIQHNDTQHKRFICDTQHKLHSAYQHQCHIAECRDLFIYIMNVVMLSVMMPAELCKTECCYAECHDAC
jgi:hypothetical protein